MLFIFRSNLRHQLICLTVDFFVFLQQINILEINIALPCGICVLEKH